MERYIPYAFTLDEVEEKELDSVWYGFAAAGMLTLIDGDPGNGKTLVAFDIAARITRGDTMPGETEPVAPASVLIFSAEDNLEQVIKPRMLAAGAVMSKCHFLMQRDPESHSMIPVTIPEHVNWMEQEIVASGCRIVIVDPIMAYLGSEINSADDMQVRKALAPLTAMAERTNCAILMIRHLNKAQGMSSMYRGGGSIAFIGASRFSFIAARHPDDPEREVRVLAPNKINVVRDPMAMTYTIQTHPEFGQPYIQWGEQIEMHAEQLVLEGKSVAEQNKLQDTITWLRTVVQDQPIKQNDLKSRCTTDGFEWSEVKQALEADGVRRRQDMFTQVWGYYYPEKRLAEIRKVDGSLAANDYE